MRVFVTGVKGQLGYDVMNELEKQGLEGIGVDIDEMDITDADQVNKVIKEAAPDAVIHCAAYTAVDAAEDNEEICRKVNAQGTENIAKVCEELDIKMMYISTDYVFNGQGERPWEPDDKREPLNVYGQTKYEGELAIEEHVKKFFTVRIAWVFGVNGKNFIKTMLNLGKTHDHLTVVNDQTGSPTYTYDLARLLVDMIQTDKYGRYHATNEGICTWYEFACEIFKQAGMNVSVAPVSSDEYPAKAKRPSNSRMDKSKLTANGFTPLPTWQDALSRYLNEYRNNKDYVIMEPNRIMPDMELKVEVKDLPGKQVAYIRLNGGYKEIDYLGTWMRLLQFAKNKNIQPLSFSPICLYHDDPKVTSPDKLRTDICMEVAPSVCPKGEIGTKKVLEGRFMVALYKGTYQQLGAVYDTLYGKYLPEMGLSLREVPSGEIYLNDPRNTKPEDLLTQIYVAVE